MTCSDLSVVNVRGVAFTVRENDFSFHTGKYIVKNFPRNSQETTRNMLVGLALVLGINVRSSVDDQPLLSKEELILLLKEYLAFLH